MDGWTPERGARNTHSRPWIIALVASLLLHVPLTPLAGLIGLVAMLLGAPSNDDAPPAPPITEIPVELLSEEPGSTAAAAPTPEPETVGVAAPPAASALPVKPRDVRDAGAPPDAGGDADAGADAGAVDAGARDAGRPDAGAADAGPADAGPVADAADAGDAGTGISDPIGVSGAARRVADANANVKIYVDTEKLRSHRLGARIGSLLRGVYQWRDFFGPTGIDPVRDVDRLFIAGPQLRSSAEVVAVIQHRLGETRMREALDELVKRDTVSGAWLEGPVPVALARADRAERYFVMPSARVVVVTPKSALAAARKLGARASVPALPGAQLATAHVATPWRAFMGMPLRVPKSIRWARARVVPEGRGGVVIHIEAEDESPEAAAQNATELTRAVTAATQLDLGIFGALLGSKPQRFVQRVSFEGNGNRIVGTLELTEAQVLSVLDFASLLLVPAAPRAVRDAGASQASPR